MALLEVKDMGFRYYGSSFELDGVSLTLNKGDRLVIYGSEGSGKTTLLRLLCGLEDYSRGSVLLGDVELRDLSQKDMDIGFTFDRRILDSNAIVGDVISMPMKLRGVGEDKIADYLESAEAKNLPINAKVKDLSDMQIALLILARLFAVDRRLYLVDDVWKDLSQEEKRIVEDYLLASIQGKSAIVATDDAILARSVSVEKILVMTDREVAPTLSLEEIVARPVNMQSAILAGYELHIGKLIKSDDKYFAEICKERFEVSAPLSDVYVDKKVCFAVKQVGERSEKEQVGDGEVMDFYYDIDVERVLNRP